MTIQSASAVWTRCLLNPVTFFPGSYTAQIVRNSRWLVELEKINSVHRGYRPEAWRDLNHYIFWFHDETFECIAESYKLELFNAGRSKLLELTCKRMTC